MRKPPQHGHITLTRLDSKPQDTRRAEIKFLASDFQSQSNKEK